MIEQILDFPMKIIYWLSGQIRGFIASRQVSTPPSDEGVANEQHAASTSPTNLLDLPMVAIYWLSGRMRSWWAKRQNRTEVVVAEGEPQGTSEGIAPLQEGGNPLRFRPDLWALEGDQKMAMDVRPYVIVLKKPWLALFSSATRKVGKSSVLALLFQTVEIHTDSKLMVFTTSAFADTIGTTYPISLVDIQVPQKVNIPGFWSFIPEWVFGLTVISFSVKGSDEKKFMILSRRGMWWPASLHRPTSRRITAGSGYVLALEALARWAKSGQWV